MSNDKSSAAQNKRKKEAYPKRPPRKKFADDRTPAVKKIDRVCKVIALILTLMFFANIHVLVRGGGYDDSKIVTVMGFASSKTQSDVMEPAIMADSAVFTMSRDSYETGDIVQYYDEESNSNPLRRITEVSDDGNSYVVRGDNEPDQVAIQISAEDVSGRILFSSTFLYGFLKFYNTALGAAVTVILAFLMLMMSDILMFKKRRAELIAKREARARKEALMLKNKQNISGEGQTQEKELNPIEKRQAKKQAKLEKERAEIANEMKALQKKMKAEEEELDKQTRTKKGKKK
ncbi:MAG TPA: hypothetical protein IAD16_01005 [Candidatus Fimisoma avicola]|uniref:Signal peptidase I n=1 Tax=Candidatus Fimisoma avicola TaxID=2840826 RepID=A0A9D1I2F7_9FIRM|nr:hypothetical protein [Candidatus Fimisoma avicola]